MIARIFFLFLCVSVSLWPFIGSCRRAARFLAALERQQGGDEWLPPGAAALRREARGHRGADLRHRRLQRFAAGQGRPREAPRVGRVPGDEAERGAPLPDRDLRLQRHDFDVRACRPGLADREDQLLEPGMVRPRLPPSGPEERPHRRPLPQLLRRRGRRPGRPADARWGRDGGRGADPRPGMDGGVAAARRNANGALPAEPPPQPPPASAAGLGHRPRSRGPKRHPG